MKIAMVSEHASPLAVLGEVDAGGQNVYVAELSAALVRAGHDVTVYTRRDDGVLDRFVDAPGGYRVVHVPAGPAAPVPKDELLPHMENFAKFLQLEWLRDPPDVVHAHFWMSGLASVLAAKRPDVPVIQTFHALGVVKRRHQGHADTSPPQRIGVERALARRVARVAATCSDEVFELVRMGLPRSRMSVVPCGVDVGRFTSTGPVAFRRGYHRLVSVGRLLPRKGFDTVIAALRGLPGTELVIAGGPAKGRLSDDDEAKRLKHFAAEAGVAERVRLVGQVTRRDMPRLLRSADLVVCTPWYEPFGIVPLEAMACGVPVVASAVGGLTDTVVDGVTGALVPPEQPAALAPTIRRLLNDPALRQAYGCAAVDRVRSRYSWSRIAMDIHGVYGRVLSHLQEPEFEIAVGESS
jgi:glycosyltransferase involved in cell wall biosynthesis